MLSALAILALVLSQEQEPAAAPLEPRTLPPGGYADLGSMPDHLRVIARANNGTLVELARTAEGRPVLALSLGASQAPGRPEVMIVANLEGDRIAATELALLLARHCGVGSALTEVATVHFIPLANPDAAVRAAAGEEVWRGGAVDEDRDGLLDEDGPRDLDGDGRALWMRVPDPSASSRPDPADARATDTAERAEGESGGRLLREGGDADGDRELVEDPPGGIRVDVNFPQRWREHRSESGPFALSTPEGRGLADFLLAHPHIALVIVLDDQDNSAEPPKGKDRMERDASDLLTGDAALLKLWSKRLYGDDGKAAGSSKPRDGADGAGSFADWAYFQVGALTLTSSLWSPPLDAKLEGAEELPKDASEEAKLLRWADLTYGGAAFVPWSAFNHPQRGAVEIGGWLPLVRANPPIEEMEGIAARWTGFLDSLASDFARLEWDRVEVTDLGGGVYEARATLVNRGLMPTMSSAGAQNRRPRPLMVSFEVPGGEILAGRKVQSVERLDGLGGTREFRWMYRSDSGAVAQARASSQTAGEALVSLEVSR
ncbi:MAG: M14 family zinc carboxypeptidase [Planctomycetota bacterium]|nr:M14 family zinc carboxypeptidase [Planctomycetota bacterium]